jgi:hypothetical protein
MVLAGSFWGIHGKIGIPFAICRCDQLRFLHVDFAVLSTRKMQILHVDSCPRSYFDCGRSIAEGVGKTIYANFVSEI